MVCISVSLCIKFKLSALFHILSCKSKFSYQKTAVFRQPLNKYYKENCLVEQEFVRSDLFQGSVNGYIADTAKKLGTEIKATEQLPLSRQQHQSQS